MSDCGCVSVDNSGDECDDCYGVPHGIAIVDCADVCGGTSWMSDCGCVSVDNSGDECDDCAGTPNGTDTIDDCSICGGSGASIICEGAGAAVCDVSDCDDAWDGDACTMPDNSIHLKANGSVLYNSITPIAGFQFTVNGATMTDASGGATQAAGFISDASTNLMLAFSLTGSTIPSGCGTLINLQLSGNTVTISEIIFSDEDNNAIPITYYGG
jgi:hypothetical protein